MSPTVRAAGTAPRRADRRIADLERALAGHLPGDRIEAEALKRTRTLLRWLRRPFDQQDDPTHVTGSAIVLDGRGRVLLHRHKRLGIWLQPGGHVEGDEDPATAARREVLEETGVSAAHRGGAPDLVHVDVHQGPRGHVHLDLRFALLDMAGSEPAPGPDESPQVAWCEPDGPAVRADRSLAAAVRATRR